MNKRRKLLLALPGISVATVWKKPVVDTVLLPAHAVISCDGLVIPDVLNTCANPNENLVSYHVDDTGEGCPELIGGRGTNPVNTIDIYGQSATSIGIVIETTENTNAPGSQDCSDPGADVNIAGSLSFEALSGTQWRVSFTLIRRADHVGIVDIGLGIDT